MAQCSDIERRLCLVWKSENPYLNKPRKSSDFSLLGFEWNLQLQYYRIQDNYHAYRLSLNQGTEIRNLEESLQFHVSTFIENREKLPVLGQCKKIRTTNETLFEYSKNNMSSSLPAFLNYGEMKIICLFHDFSSSTTFDTKNETIILSTQADTDSPLASGQDSNLPSKDTFRSEKCVQACLGVPPDLENLSIDFCKLLDQKIFPDAQLKCGDRITPVHKSILAARSEVFTAMFRNKMVESETGLVDVTDLDATVLDLLLKYVYSGKVQDLSDDTASSLYAAGDKYAIHALKKACSDWMVRNLSEENCLVSLILADAHSDESFKDDVANFISQHLQVLRTPAWLKLNEEHPRVANIVYQKCFASNFDM